MAPEQGSAPGAPETADSLQAGKAGGKTQFGVAGKAAHRQNGKAVNAAGKAAAKEAGKATGKAASEGAGGTGDLGKAPSNGKLHNCLYMSIKYSAYHLTNDRNR